MAGADTARFGFEGMSFPICSLFGVATRVHVTLPLVAGISVLSAGLAGAGLLGILFALLVNGPLVLLTVWIHEIGHVAAARCRGFKPDHILLWPLGGLAYISKDGITPKEQIFVSACGPITHVPMFVLWGLLVVLIHKGGFTLSTAGMSYEHHFVAALGVVMMINNIAMFVFNLFVPCIPLDCSQILIAALLLCGFEAATAAKVMVFVSVPVVLLLLAYGIYAFVQGAGLAALTIMMALWLGLQTYRLYQAAQAGELARVPLFANAMSMKRDAGGAAPAAGGAAGGGFRPFEGEGRTLGKLTTGTEVCITSLLAIAVNAVAVAQMAPSLRQ